MQKCTISNLKESWPQMNKVDPYSTIDHSHKNTRWIYVSEKCHIKCNKVLCNSGNSKKWQCYCRPKVFNPNRPKGTNPNHANKGAEVEHAGNCLITYQWWELLTNTRETTNNEKWSPRYLVHSNKCEYKDLKSNTWRIHRVGDIKIFPVPNSEGNCHWWLQSLRYYHKTLNLIPKMCCSQ